MKRIFRFYLRWFLIFIGCYFVFWFIGFAAQIGNEKLAHKDFLEFKLPEDKLPIFYHDDYNISLFKLEELHPFDSKKYGKIVSFLVDETEIKRSDLITPKEISDEVLASHHSEEYLDSLFSPLTLMQITEVPPLVLFPPAVNEWRVLRPMRLATSGSILATLAALEYGWAVNLGGGFHHASSMEGGGFCVYADIGLAVKIAREKYPKLGNILYLDLDAHQGNGPGRDFLNDKRVHIIDFYNNQIYPNDIEAKKSIKQDIGFGYNVEDSDYLGELSTELTKAVESKKFDLVIFNAGTDSMHGDPLGGWKLTDDGIIKRDGIVFKFSKDNNIPIVMLLSGGYQKRNARVIADSLKMQWKRLKSH